MRTELRDRIKPAEARPGLDFSDNPIKNPSAAADKNPANKVSFKDLISNSNDESSRQRAAQKNGDGLRRAKTDEEFAKMMSDQLNKDNIRKPQNNLDKDSFLKLFITQMQNQDPLNPDDSAEMAAQLAQFNGLEQMMNVNKNLEKMQNDQALTRGISLLPFVGKEVKLGNGKIRVEGGNVTKAVISLKQEVPKATLEVRDSAGVLVSTKDMGSLKRGEEMISWDGRGLDGSKVSDGSYTLQVTGKDLNDQDIPVDVYSIVKVKGIDFKESGGLFETDIGRIGIGEVISVGTEGILNQPTALQKPRDLQSEANKMALENPVGVKPPGDSVTVEKVSPSGALETMPPVAQGDASDDSMMQKTKGVIEGSKPAQQPQQPQQARQSPQIQQIAPKA